MSKVKQLNKSDINTMTIEEAREAVSVFAKRANQRLRELEKQGVDQASNAYRKISSYHYDKREFVDTTRKGQIKFSTKLAGRSLNQLRSELKQLELFLNRAKTSTPTGIEKMYRAAYNTFNERYGEIAKEKMGRALTFNEYAEMWQDAKIRTFIEVNGSDVGYELYAEIKGRAIPPDQMDAFWAQWNERMDLMSTYELLDRASGYEPLNSNFW